MQRNESDVTGARQIADRIRERFPSLDLVPDEDDPDVDWSIEIPAQTGLPFECHLNRQGDELHLSIGSFWLEWFPLDRKEIVDLYIDTVIGVLDGSYRIVEFLRWGRPVGAILEAPDRNDWKRIGTSSRSVLPLSWFTTTRLLQNHQATLLNSAD